MSRLILALSCALMCACAAADPNAPGLSADADSEDAELRLIGPDEVHVLPNASVDVRARYLGPPGSVSGVEGVAVQAAVVDVGWGASLPEPEQTTDADGEVTFSLRVGSSPAKFELRLSAENAPPVYVSVNVGDALNPTVTARIDYDGSREIKSRTVTLIPGMDCERVLLEGLTAEPTFTLPEDEETADFELGPGLEYALAAWGRDGTGAKVALGCTRIQAPTTASRAEATLERTIELRDIPFELRDAHEVIADFAMAATNAELARELEAAVRGEFSEAASGEAEAQAAFMVERVRVQLPTLDAQAADALETALTSKLATAEQGPLVLAAALGELLAARAQSLTIRFSLAAGDDAALEVRHELPLALADADARPNAQPLIIDSPDYAVAFSGAYDDSIAAVDVAQLQVSLGLGAYATALWDAEVAEDGGDGRFASAFGCALVAEALEERPADACGGECGREACEKALLGFLDELRLGLVSLDERMGGFKLSGTISAHDRDDDGVINDLGPGALSGTWDAAEGDGVPISAEVRTVGEMRLAL